MQHALVECAREEIIQEVSASPFVGILVDETVNVNIKKKFIFIRYMKDGKAASQLIGNFDVPDGTAETITNKITCVLQQRNIPIAKVVGFGSDGAAVMTRRVLGFSTCLEQLNPRMTSVYCTAHRVALASSGAAAKVNTIKQYRQTVNTVFNYFKYSACHYERLQELNRILGEGDFRSLKEPCSVRWLSLSRAVYCSSVKMHGPM
ncbi:Zinc finger protein 862 [Acipenser ruthenus]|uniref:Zinc finger protein 862 n=1 Tax=Acipenser ruthenus TaxID=7906 RepID=A0A444UM34_ACIRT|nr:Zinc finger protein 862 [Acipenser ruthenus]